jgi:hypothetical protein
VDVKSLLYQSNPSNPDHEDIITCSVYLVGYQVKGEQTHHDSSHDLLDLSQT